MSTSTHTWLLFLHVAGAIAWIGSGIGLLVLQRQLLRADERAALLAIAHQEQALGMKLFMPASLVTLASGITMVALSEAFRFSDRWIIVGFAGIALSAVAQMGVTAPASKRYLALLDHGGGDGGDLAAAARRMTSGNVLDVAVLLAVVWAMVAKPTW